MAEEKVTQETQQEENATEGAPFDTFVEHQRKAFEEAGKALESLLPPAFVEHSKAALEESKRGFQSLLESVGAGFEKKSDAPEEGSTGTNKVKIEVN